MNLANPAPESKSAESQQSSGPQAAPTQPILSGLETDTRHEHGAWLPSRIPRGLMAELGTFACCVYWVIRDAWYPKKPMATVSLKTIAARVGGTPRGVAKAIKRLKKCGLLGSIRGASPYGETSYWFRGPAEVNGGTPPEWNGGSTPEWNGGSTPEWNGGSTKRVRKNSKNNGNAASLSAEPRFTSSSSSESQSGTTTTTQSGTEVPLSELDLLEIPAEVWMEPDKVYAYFTSRGQTGPAKVLHFDLELRHQMWAACRQHAPDCTAAQIVRACLLKYQDNAHRRTPIGNWPAFLVVAVPKTFEGRQ